MQSLNCDIRLTLLLRVKNNIIRNSIITHRRERRLKRKVRHLKTQIKSKTRLWQWGGSSSNSLVFRQSRCITKSRFVSLGRLTPKWSSCKWSWGKPSNKLRSYQGSTPNSSEKWKGLLVICQSKYSCSLRLSLWTSSTICSWCLKKRKTSARSTDSARSSCWRRGTCSLNKCTKFLQWSSETSHLCRCKRISKRVDVPPSVRKKKHPLSS